MRKTFHFITGLPRSGSTLLSALLRQNQAFHADVSSPVAGLIAALMPPMSNNGEFQTLLNNEIRERILRGIFENFYADNPARVIFDTNRTWMQKIPVLLKLFPQSRFICCVRSITEVLQSFEKLYYENPLQLSTIVGQNANTTVYARIDSLMSPAGMVGVAVNGMKEAFYGPHSDRLMFVPYENLVDKPELTLETIYSFVGEKLFKHDLQNIAFAADDYDNAIGAPGLHKVRPKIGATKQTATIPPDLTARYAGLPFWVTDRAATKANLTLV